MTYRVIFLSQLCISLVFGLYGQNVEPLNISVGKIYTTDNLGPDFPHLQKAKISIQIFDYEQAILHLDNAIAQNPYSVEAYVLRADLKQKMGMGTEASQDMMLAKRLNPHAIDLFGYNGINGQMNSLYYNPEAYQEHLELSQTIKYYETKVGKLDSIDSEIEIREAMVYIENNELDFAKEKLLEILSNDVKSELAYDLLGIIHMELGDLKTAESMFQKAVLLDPYFSIAWYNLGIIEKKKKNFEKAKIYIDKSTSLENTLTKAYFERATLSRITGNQEAAIMYYDTIIDISGGKYVEAYINRALVKKSLGDFTGALTDLNVSINNSLDHPGLYKNRGNLYFLFGMYDKALEDYSKAIELNSEFAEAYFNRALTHIVLLDNITACSDLMTSESLGYNRSNDFQMYFCID